MPKVSVCMAAYNHEKYVGTAIQSVMDQTFQDWELIITDDSSTDGTPEIISQYNDPRIKFFQAPQNQGIAATTANCIKESQGEYISILNSDDQYRPTKLEVQAKFLDEHPEVGAAFSYTWFINRSGKDYNPLNIGFYSNKRNIFNKPNRTRWEWLRHFFYHHNCLCDPSVMARREVYTEIAPPDPRFPIMGDFNRWVRLCMRKEIFIIPETLINFRIHGKNASGSWLGPQPKISWELMLVLQNFLEISDVEDLKRIFPERFEQMDLDKDLIPYYLAMVALEINSLTYRLFAVECLSDLLNNTILAGKLSQKHGFDHREFRKLCRSI